MSPSPVAGEEGAAHFSLSSPLGKSLIGKGVDDDVEVQTPKGKRAYSIKKLITIHKLLAAENGASKSE